MTVPTNYLVLSSEVLQRSRDECLREEKAA